MRSTLPSREQRGAFYLTSNRNKRSIVVNLKQPAGSALVQRLAETADVFVQNFRPGVADRLGLGEHHLREKHPRLIYVSISGFGESGPLAGRRVYDTVVQACSGMAVMQGTSTDAPHMVRTVIADKVTAQTVCQGITAALLERERSGEGQHIHISMLHAMIAWLWPDGMSHFTFMDGDEGSGRGGISQDQLMFHAVDGMLVVAAVTNAEWHAIARAIERPELGTDARVATPRARAKNHAAMRTILAERVQTATTAARQRRPADD